MGKQNRRKAEKQRKNKLEAAARVSRKWTKDFYRKNRADDKPENWNQNGQKTTESPT